MTFSIDFADRSKYREVVAQQLHDDEWGGRVVPVCAIAINELCIPENVRVCCTDLSTLVGVVVVEAAEQLV